jgi:hypothetical protein
MNVESESKRSVNRIDTMAGSRAVAEPPAISSFRTLTRNQGH